MPTEGEEGFTFVDKRHMTPGDSAPPPMPEVAETEDTEALDDTEEAEEHGARHSLTVRDRLLMSIDILHQGAWIAMGLVPDPATGEIAQDLAGARKAVDAVAALADLIGADLDDRTRKELQNLVNDLRLNYVKQANA